MMMIRLKKIAGAASILLAVCSITVAQDKPIAIDTRPFTDNAGHWYNIQDGHSIINALPGKPKYKPTQLREIGDNMLLFQKENGGWPKNYDFFAILNSAQKDSVLKAKQEQNTTFDNGTGYTHVTALSQIYTATGEAKYKEAAIRGLEFILKAQYANGGWPQYYPLEKGYSKHITFNDGALEGIMELLQDVVNNEPIYAYVDAATRTKIKAAYNRGLDCILKTQINDAGKPTAWCQQYDEVTLQPAWARKFEPPSICNGESVDVVLFLMKIENPDKRVKDAVRYANQWFLESKILNTRVDRVPAPRLQTPFRISTTDVVVTTDSAAAPIWTRYYELKTHKPLFCNRDSKVVYSLAEVERERRDGYSWYTYSPQKVINKYAAWAKKWGVE